MVKDGEYAPMVSTEGQQSTFNPNAYNQNNYGVKQIQQSEIGPENRACCCGLCPCLNKWCCCRTACRTRISILLCILLILLTVFCIGYYIWYINHICENGNGYQDNKNNKCYYLLTCNNAINGTEDKTCDIMSKPSKGHYQILNHESIIIELELKLNYSIPKMHIHNNADAVDGTYEDDILIYITLEYFDYLINDWNSNVTITYPSPGFGWNIWPYYKYQNQDENITDTNIVSDKFRLYVDNEQILLHVDLNKWWIWGEPIDDW